MRDFKSYTPEIVSILILILIVIPSMLYYNQNSDIYSINSDSVTWSPDRTKIAFIRFKNNNNDLGEIMVWSKDLKSFQSIGYITTPVNNGCYTYEYAICLQGQYGLNLRFSFSPDNNLLVLMPSYATTPITFIIYNLTAHTIMQSKNFDESGGVGLTEPSVTWMNDSFWYAGKEGLENLLNNQTLYSYAFDSPTSSPILSPDGKRVAYTTIDPISNTNNNAQSIDISNSKFSLIVRNIQTNSLLANVSLEAYSTPMCWSSNSSELFFYANLQNPRNDSIYNVDSEKITYSIHSPQWVYALTPDFKYITFQGQSSYNRLDLDNNINTTIPNTYYSNPEVSLVYTGNEHVFNVSTFPNLETFFSYNFTPTFEKNLGFTLTIVGIGAIAILLITKYQRGLKNFFKNFLT